MTVGNLAIPNEPLNREQIKKEMVMAFKRIKLDVYTDILRIKQPHKTAIHTGQMLCKVVNSFRGGTQRSNNDPLFEDWTQIQEFVHKRPNVIKFHQEIY
jgi:hypothetical protein